MYDYIYEKCKKDNYYLGWSSEFKGIAVPLFILLLNKNRIITKATEKLIASIIYRLGFREDNVIDFFDLFLNWKDKQVVTNQGSSRPSRHQRSHSSLL